MNEPNDYNMSSLIKIKFKRMDYYVMPRYKHHYIDNEYERFSLQLLKNNLDEKSLFVDIGAHYGAYSLYAADTTKCSVIALEPVLENFEILNKNIKSNELTDRIQAFNYAASSQNGEAEFHIPWASDSAGFYDHPNARTIKKQKVQVKKVDELLRGKKVDLIKIDTEGHEIEVLKGLKKTLLQNPTTKLIIELNPSCIHKAGKRPIDLLQAIKKLDKEIYVIDEEKFILFRITSDLEKYVLFLNKNGYANLLCVPKKDHHYLSFISHSENIAGAELAMVEEIKHLNNYGILAHVIIPRAGPLEEVLKEGGISHSIIGNYSFWTLINDNKNNLQQVRTNALASVKIKDLIEKIGATHVVNNTIVNPWGFLAAKTLGLPLIWFVHEFGDIDHQLNFMHDLQLVRRFIMKSSNLIVSCSNAVRETLLQKEANLNDKLIRAYYPFQPEQIEEKSKQSIKPVFTSNKNILKLCIVGTVSKGKGHIHAIEAISLLEKRNIQCELICIGPSEKTYKAFLKRRLKDLSLDNKVKFLGFQENPFPYMKAADAYLMCSTNEAFGRVTIEAMLCGVPVIGAASGGTLEIIDDNNSGFLFEPTSPKSLASAISRMQKSDTHQIILAAKKKALQIIDPTINMGLLWKSIISIKTDANSIEYNKIFTTEWLIALDLQESQLIETQQKISVLTKERRAQQQHINYLEEKLKKLIKSRSWRYTQLVRKARNLFND